MNELYKLKGNEILKEGHTMFLEDVIRDLNNWRNKSLSEERSSEVKDE